MNTSAVAFAMAGVLALAPAAWAGQQPRSTCPVEAAAVLPELVGSWQVLIVQGLDRPAPESTRATATISPELNGCLLRERVIASTGTPPYEALVLWGVNGPDEAIQRVFAHSQHGRFGVYQGRRSGADLPLVQQPLGSPPTAEIVRHRVSFRDRDHIQILSEISTDRGVTWVALSRWEYERR